MIKFVDKKVNFGEEALIETVAYSKDGKLLILGGTDGIIEVWDPYTKALKTELSY